MVTPLCLVYGAGEGPAPMFSRVPGYIDIYVTAPTQGLSTNSEYTTSALENRFTGHSSILPLSLDGR